MGFCFMNVLVSRFGGGESLGLMKKQPWEIASKGAGPSYGKPNPIKTLASYKGRCRRRVGYVGMCAYWHVGRV